jgi:hypothetical protein
LIGIVKNTQLTIGAQDRFLGDAIYNLNEAIRNLDTQNIPPLPPNRPPVGYPPSFPPLTPGVFHDVPGLVRGVYETRIPRGLVSRVIVRWNDNVPGGRDSVGRICIEGHCSGYFDIKKFGETVEVPFNVNSFGLLRIEITDNRTGRWYRAAFVDSLQVFYRRR